MATMVKEKRREKKKTKEKSRAKTNVTDDIALNISEAKTEEAEISTYFSNEQLMRAETSEKINNSSDNDYVAIAGGSIISEKLMITETHETAESASVSDKQTLLCCESHTEVLSKIAGKDQTVSATSTENVTDNYEYLSSRLEWISVPKTMEPISDDRELELSHPDAYLKPSIDTVPETGNIQIEGVANIIPSAPIFEEEIQPLGSYQQEVIKDVKTKLKCMPLEEAINLFGGAEMTAVKAMSVKEEAIVEAGPVSGPEHPLVDLLSTFRSSLRALENERSRLTCGFAEEEKSRSTLWKIEKHHINLKKQCKCGTNVELKASYEHAEFLRERLPVARLRLEGLLRDVQDSYCHHQHAALLTHCQIEEFISETIGSNKAVIREALSLILQALRLSDGVAVESAALRRWAVALVAALVDERDVSQLLFVLHHLFRQNRSVRWAARVLRPRVSDAASAARMLAVLETLLASPRLDMALECTEEEGEEGWEEVSARGAGGAVSEGALREIDLLALLRAFPLRDLVSRVLLFTHADIRSARPYEWGDSSGGRETARACGGVRGVLAACRRAAAAHAHYARLNARLRVVAAAALDALASLYQSPRAPYEKDMEEKLQAELEACFTEGMILFGKQDLHKLATTLLTEDSARDYCLTFIVGLHDKSPKLIESLSVEAPAVSCGVRVRIVTHAAARRTTDHELARIVLDFLLQTGVKMRSPSCKGGCAGEARACLPTLLAAHPYLRTVALHTVSHMAQVDTLEPSVVDVLHVRAWRPQCGEVRAVLEDWALRCPQLLHQLLMQLDYTPSTGVSHAAQLVVGAWLCERARTHPASAEERWRELLRLRTHAAWWPAPAPASALAPAPAPAPTDLISLAYALLASCWGDTIPLICSSGVEALCSLTSRPREAVHCLAPIMLVMANSPESVSLTPKFGEVFTALLTHGPSLVQRALGRGGLSGADLLLRLVLDQVEGQICEGSAPCRTVSVWLHALWRVPLPAAAGVLDVTLLAARDWPTLDAHAAILLQDENAKEHVTNAVRNASIAPLLCECLLRAYHTHREVATGMFGAVSNILWEQRINAQKIHVDNALQKINADISSEELVIYRSATAALAAPLHHPSHLALWRLFFHLYLQRPPCNMRDTAIPVGPLYYSGIIKTRTLAQIKKRLQETAAYHHSEAETYKKDNNNRSSQQPSDRVVKSESITLKKGLLPALSIKDLTGESSESSDSDSDSVSDDSEEENRVEAIPDDTSDVDKKNAFNMACYHTAAERMVREFVAWLEEGDRVRAAPHLADIARFIPEQALEAAWKNALSRCRPPPSPDTPPTPRPVSVPPSPPVVNTTPLDDAVSAIMRIKDKSKTKSRRIIRSPLEDVNVSISSRLFDAIDKHLKDIDTLAKEWNSEVSRVSTIDNKLWELVAALRVPRPLQPVTKHCPNTKEKKCKPIVFYLNEREWCISIGVEQAIKENRSSSRAALRRLARARPHAARTAAALHSIARRIRDKPSAVSAVERAWRAAGAGAGAGSCRAAHAALAAFVELLAERWICPDAAEVSRLLSRWCGGGVSSLQETLCGSLVSPRAIDPATWPLVYTTLLDAKLPSHTIFSYLSKFEMGHWSRSASPAARRELATALISAQARHGPAPPPQHAILLELLGVHTAAVLTEEELCTAVMQLATLAADGRLPPSQWTHVVRAAETVGGKVPFDRLGHVLRDLGALWWRARSLYNGAATLVPHAAHVATLQAVLLRCFVAAAVQLSYQPERVGRCAWSALLESWSAWVSPLPGAAPLLPSLAREGDSEYSRMLHSFHACLETIMDDCPGSEIALLQLTFEWCCASHAQCAVPPTPGAGAGAAARRECRVQAAEARAALAALPWDQHHWFYGNSLQVAAQICATDDREMMSWSYDRWRDTDADTLLRGVTEDTLEACLVTLLYLFTGTRQPLHQHIVEEASRLPWWRLPEAALGEALDRFFAVHHDPAHPYHDLPHLQVVLLASGLRLSDSVAAAGASCVSRDKRARAVSQWSHAAVAPALAAHVAQHSHCMLQTLTELAPYLESSEGELEELLGRASVIMCMEPAAAVALPVWLKWLESAPARLASSCVSAACALTALPYCAALADAAVRAHLRTNESGWSEVVQRWAARSPWRDAHEFASRACAHAAYACALAHSAPEHAAPTLRALQTTNINFVVDEPIIGAWICYACRAALACAPSETGAAAARAPSEAVAAARALLAAWAQPPRRSILRVVTLHADTERTTAPLRLLCRLAECIISPSPGATQAYEAACAAAPAPDVVAWGRAPQHYLLPRLAIRLYPKHERYFQCEMEAISNK